MSNNNNKRRTEMSNNKKKSRRNWEYSGYKQCDECRSHGVDDYHYDTFTSWRPYKFVLCRACYEFIYKYDRKQQPTPCCPWYHQPSLFDETGE
jgi:hypothetical protein